MSQDLLSIPAPAGSQDGYWADATGALIPCSKVKEIDQLRHGLVFDLCQRALALHRLIAEFKLDVVGDHRAFIDLSVEQYGVKLRGEGDNVTLTSFDGLWKVVRQRADHISFGEQLMAAKALIDECVHEWTEGTNDNIRVLVAHAFQTDKEGKINVGRVLGLRRLKIEHARWQQAMRAIEDSMQVASSKSYLRFYRRDKATDAWQSIVLDAAAV